jgi:hypothetical protein
MLNQGNATRSSGLNPIASEELLMRSGQVSPHPAKNRGLGFTIHELGF